MVEPLDIEFRRDAGPGREALSGTFRDFELSADDDRAWLGGDPPRPLHVTMASGSEARYELTFRRGGERRRVVLRESDLDARLRPLVDQLEQLCRAH